MSRLSRARPAHKTLPENFNHRLNLYSLGAAAAGVSMMALAQPAEGEVVVTQTNVQIVEGQPASIDLNNDGINDFKFSVTFGGYVPDFIGSLAVTPLTGGKLIGGNRSPQGPYASALVSGANIGSTAHFSSSVGRGQITVERSTSSQTAVPSHRYYGEWHNVSNRYLGVKFLIAGATHYGWIRLTTPSFGVAQITEYAYETVANKKIGAGATTDSDEPAVPQAQQSVSTPSGPSLGLLALGANGLALWRR